MDCINLKERFGKRFKVGYEEAYQADYGEGAWREDPWLMIIPCTGSRGHFFPWGGDKLGVSVDRRGLVHQIAGLSCCQLVQHGDDGATFIFDAADFDRVAEIMKPRRRPQHSQEYRAELAARAAKARAAIGQHRLKECDPSDRRRVSRVQPDSGVMEAGWRPSLSRISDLG